MLAAGTARRAPDCAAAEALPEGAWPEQLVQELFVRGGALIRMDDGRNALAAECRRTAAGLELRLDFCVPEPAAEAEWIQAPQSSDEFWASTTIRDTVFGFLGGTFENAAGERKKVVACDGNDSGIRNVTVTPMGGPASHQGRRVQRQLESFLTEFAPIPIVRRLALLDRSSGSSDPPFSVVDFPKLLVVLRRLGMIEKRADSLVESTAYSFLAGALSTDPPASRAQAISAACRLDAKLDTTSKRLSRADKVLKLAASHGLSAEEYGVIVRDHLIPTDTPTVTPNHTPTKPSHKEKQQGATSTARDESDSATSTSSSDSDSTEGPRPSKAKPPTKAPRARPRREIPPETEGDSTEAESAPQPSRKRRRVSFSHAHAIEQLTPPAMSALEAAAILFHKRTPQPWRDLAKFELPSDWEAEADEHEAYIERAGAAVHRVCAAIGDDWIPHQPPRDASALRLSVRERAIAQVMSKQPLSGYHTAPRMPQEDTEEGMAMRREEVAIVGATPLSAEHQVGAVSPDVAERLHAREKEIRYDPGQDVGSGIRSAPQDLRADLARAIGSNAKVDAAGEHSTKRTPHSQAHVPCPDLEGCK